MNYLHRLIAVASAAFFIAGTAQAQWQVPNNSVPIGRGTGITGFKTVTGSTGTGAGCLVDTSPPTFVTCPGGAAPTVNNHAAAIGKGVPGLNSADPGTAGNVLTSNGAGADPTFVAPTPVTTLLNTACTASPTTCVSFFGYANPVWWGADATGVADSASAINSAITASKFVRLASGTFRIASSILMKPGVTFSCFGGAKVTQGNSANVSTFFDFFTNVADGAQLDHCIVDGNYANNTAQTALVNVSGTANVKTVWNTLTGSKGAAINSSNNSGHIMEHNFISVCDLFGIAVFNTSPNIRSHAQIRYNTIYGPSLHLIQVDQADGNDISNNLLVQGSVLGGANSAMQVTISGTTATWVSGTNFAGVTLGNVLLAGGVEYPIVSVNSNTSMTLSISGSATNVAAAIGGGDVLSMTSTTANRMIGNQISGGLTGGIILAQYGGNIASSESSIGNVISGNIIEGSGNFGIGLEAITATGAPTITATTIINNIIISPGRNGVAGNGGIQLYAQTAGLIDGVIVDGNYVWDPFGIAGNFWLTGSGSANARNVVWGQNEARGFAGGTAMSDYPTFASLHAVRGATAFIIDGLAGNCGDSLCTTFGTGVGPGGGSLKLRIWYNGTLWTLIGK